MVVTQQSKPLAEQQLLLHSNEQDKLEAARQTLMDERSSIQRDLDNHQGELKSLQAIKSLALDGDEDNDGHGRGRDDDVDGETAISI